MMDCSQSISIESNNRAKSILYLASKLLMALVALLLPFTTIANATVTEVFGGPGGGQFTQSCPEGKAMVGLRVTAGAWIDGFALLCEAPVANRQEVGWIGGRGGSVQEVYCASGQFVTGVFLTFTLSSEHERRYVNSIGMVCSSSSEEGVQEICVSTQDLDVPVADACQYRWVTSGYDRYKSPAQTIDCPAGEVLIGLHGRAGDYVDALGMICGPRPTLKPILLPVEDSDSRLDEGTLIRQPKDVAPIVGPTRPSRASGAIKQLPSVTSSNDKNPK